jgi:hypothetical protein
MTPMVLRRPSHHQNTPRFQIQRYLQALFFVAQRKAAHRP